MNQKLDENVDVETIKTADVETLLPAAAISATPIASDIIENHLEQDYPSDPNETDQVSRNPFKRFIHPFDILNVPQNNHFKLFHS